MQISDPQPSTMRNYYRFQSKVYDATRWSFLFGRNQILKQLPLNGANVLMEVGCGTGRNLRILAEANPSLELVGVDVSPDMLGLAKKATGRFSQRVRFIEKPYAPGAFQLPDPVDIVLFSYSLTMFNPGWESAIDRAWKDLKPGGHIAVVDFHRTPVGLFRLWLENNHVRFDGHLLPYLQARYQTTYVSVSPAYAGLWTYFIFIGIKR